MKAHEADDVEVDDVDTVAAHRRAAVRLQCLWQGICDPGLPEDPRGSCITMGGPRGSTCATCM